MCSADDDPTQYAATTRRPCEAKIATNETPYGPMIVRCGQSVGVQTFIDHTGIQHRACSIHLEGMKSLYPEHVYEGMS